MILFTDELAKLFLLCKEFETKIKNYFKKLFHLKTELLKGLQY